MRRKNPTPRTVEEEKTMGERFYREYNEFRTKYPTRRAKEKALRSMKAEEIIQLARSCPDIREACWYATFAQAAAEREA